MKHDFYEAKIPSKLQKLDFFAKFTQNLELKKVLLSRKEAELWNYIERINNRQRLYKKV